MAVQHLPLVHISQRRDEHAPPLHLLIVPLTHVAGAVCPVDYAQAVAAVRVKKPFVGPALCGSIVPLPEARASEPVALVHGAVLVYKHASAVVGLVAEEALVDALAQGQSEAVEGVQVMGVEVVVHVSPLEQPPIRCLVHAVVTCRPSLGHSHAQRVDGLLSHIGPLVERPIVVPHHAQTVQEAPAEGALDGGIHRPLLTTTLLARRVGGRHLDRVGHAVLHHHHRAH
mmetsp:Transcript_4148/g.9124  ORF Transcript_4148/g.9124 Transcript_4148/m.9124 type:complete len:228 (-) Transcript_4148:416-1099(-)